ncbi:hypothetical protein ACFWTE_17035 [Nocardiopsis sp. NPDC058631]|uniref:hypothetical protein n=1 Tax=Nocardiopsis sp. NPDC058631 TaxID=3346566 RepID=UPI003667ABE8
MSTELAAHYVVLHDEASDEYERHCWLERVIDVREQKRAVAPTDRDALVRCIEAWTDALHGLRRIGS